MAANGTDKKRKPTKTSRTSKTSTRRPYRESKPLLNDEQKRILRIFTAIFASVIAIFTLVSMVSYAFSWSADQSMRGTDLEWREYMEIENLCGKLGFVWADFLISKLFGLGAFTVPIFFCAISLVCFKIKGYSLIRLFIASLFGAIIISVLSAYIASLFNAIPIFDSGAGGSYGYYANLWLCSMIGRVGTGIILSFLLILWVTTLTPKVAFWIDNALQNIANKPTNDEQSEQISEEDINEHSDEETFELTDDVVDDEDIDEIEEDEIEEEEVEEEEIERNVEDIEEEDEEEVEDVSEENSSVVKNSTPLFERIIPQSITKNVVYTPDPDFENEGEENPSTDREIDIVVENESEPQYSQSELEHLYNPRLDLSGYEFPSTSMLIDYKRQQHEVSKSELEKNKVKIVNALNSYKIKVVGISAKMGPTVTLYKIKPAEGVRVAQVKRLEEDIAISLGSKGVRVLTIADSIGIEVPNDKPSVVPLKNILNSAPFQEKLNDMDLPIALGITVSNEPYFIDLAKMPHLLIAGATGMGKSVCLNAIITSLLFTKHPAELKFVMIDPKTVELDFYQVLEKHYLAMLPDADQAIITDTSKVISTLNSLCIEMEERYALIRKGGERKISDYNDKFLKRKLNPNDGHRFLPFLVVVIDEFADLIMTAGREIETPIARLAQMARAVGIHLIIATQRPTTNIITGTIKANFNSRIAFKVNAMVDSKTILDQSGAQRLIGRGDMLIMTPTSDGPIRAQCAMIGTNEVEEITQFIGSQRGFSHAYSLPEPGNESSEGSVVGVVDFQKRDKLFDEAANIIVQYQKGSTSLVQRKLNIGYARAGRIMDQLEAAGIVGPINGSNPRDVYISDFAELDKLIKSLDA